MEQNHLWDTFAVNRAGVGVTGKITSPTVFAEFKQNKIFVYSRHNNRLLTEISNGCVRCEDLHITAIRGPRSGIYGAMYYDVDNVGRDVVIGCAALGRDASDNYIGITADLVEYLKVFLYPDYSAVTALPSELSVATTDSEFDYDAVLSALVEEQRGAIPDWVAAVSLTNGRRHNQGDERIIRRLEHRGLLKGIPQDAAYRLMTRVGEAQAPIADLKLSSLAL